MHDPAAGVGVLAALFAGTVSFLSPCVLPLVPGYLSAVTGVSVNDLERARARSVLRPSLLFVLSFSTIFVLLGLSATGVGSALSDHRATLEKVSAALIVAMGAFFVASLLFGIVKRHYGAIMAGGGVVLIAMGVLVWTGELFQLNIEAQRLLSKLGLDFFNV